MTMGRAGSHGTDGARSLVAILWVAVGACAVDPLPPYGEVVLHVNTDLPAPRLAGRLRIDLYDAEGRWFETRDLARPNPDDWPLSFSVYTEDLTPVRVWVRLRAYPEGKLRDYDGERFQDWPLVLEPAGDGNGLPRLLREGMDETPAQEPDPLLAVDRLILVEIAPDSRRHGALVLHGACAGTMARFGEVPDLGPQAGGASSCGKVAQQRSRVDAMPLQSAPSSESKCPGWPGEACDPFPDPDVGCVEAHALVLGSKYLAFGDYTDAAPERLIGVGRFWMDVQEVTVGRYRSVLARGFAPTEPPTANDGDLSSEVDESACTFTSSEGDREGFALNCVPWETARAFCAFVGGDLPTEAQWELAATQEGRDEKTPFPWGQTDPSCDHVVFGRATLAGIEGHCAARGWGPVPLGTDDGLDVSPAGVRGLAGGMSEWMRDAAAGYESSCWGASVLDPWCDLPGNENRSVRGGAWASPLPTLVGTFRMARAPRLKSSFVGFRCVYEVSP